MLRCGNDVSPAGPDQAGSQLCEVLTMRGESVREVLIARSDPKRVLVESSAGRVRQAPCVAVLAHRYQALDKFRTSSAGSAVVSAAKGARNAIRRFKAKVARS